MSQDNNIIVLNQEADEEEISVNIAELALLAAGTYCLRKREAR